MILHKVDHIMLNHVGGQEAALIFLAFEPRLSFSKLGIWENRHIFHAEVQHVDKPKI